MLLLFAVVWTTDVLGYFAGRAFGGPKLMPADQPEKNLVGRDCRHARRHDRGCSGRKNVSDRSTSIAIALVALLLSVVAQLGDLLESWIKRQFGAKDASQLIPGHGGVMDRLDGFWAAALVACLIGLLRGGFGDAARRPAGMVSV